MWRNRRDTLVGFRFFYEQRKKCFRIQHINWIVVTLNVNSKKEVNSFVITLLYVVTCKIRHAYISNKSIPRVRGGSHLGILDQGS